MEYHYQGTVTRTEALEILALHSLTPSKPTAFLDGVACEDSTFDIEMGIRDHYTVREIKHWLGY